MKDYTLLEQAVWVAVAAVILGCMALAVFA